MLTSSSAYTREAFLNFRRLFLDSSALIEWASGPAADAIFQEVLKEYSLLVSTVSILEVGFGTHDKAGVSEVERAKSIYELALKEPIDFHSLHRMSLGQKRAPSFGAYNPTPHEWYAARHNLLTLLQSKKRGMKATLKLVNDAVISGCSWNSRAALITENLNDFVLLTTSQHPTVNGELRHMPIFTVRDVSESLRGVVSYPENLPSAIRRQYGI